MSDPATAAEKLVLHIRLDSARNEQADKVSQWVRDAGASELTVTDVYRGLARLGDSRSACPQAVIVCLDGLSSAEMDFFAILPRMDRKLPIFIYGSSLQATRLNQATKMGAKKLSGSNDLAVAPASDVAVPSVDDAPEPASKPQHQAELRIASDDDEEYEPDREAAEPNANQVDDTAAVEPRVPWQKYGQAPARSGPARTQPSSNGSENPNKSTPRRVAPEPLVSDEELRALIGDPIDKSSGEASS